MFRYLATNRSILSLKCLAVLRDSAQSYKKLVNWEVKYYAGKRLYGCFLSSVIIETCAKASYSALCKLNLRLTLFHQFFHFRHKI